MDSLSCADSGLCALLDMPIDGSVLVAVLSFLATFALVALITLERRHALWMLWAVCTAVGGRVAFVAARRVVRRKADSAAFAELQRIEGHRDRSEPSLVVWKGSPGDETEQPAMAVRRSTALVLGVTAINFSNKRVSAALCRRVISLSVAFPTAIRFHINDYGHDQTGTLPCTANGTEGSRPIMISRVAGSKAMLWRAVLTAEYTSPYEYIWLFDSDLEISASHFHLAHVLGVLESTRAPLLQPTTIPSRAGGASTHWHNLQLQPDLVNSGCLVRTTPLVEVQSPFFRRRVWQGFYRDVLSQLPHELLHACDWLDAVMCPYARSFPIARHHNALGGTAAQCGQCLITQGALLTHVDSGEHSFSVGNIPNCSLLLLWVHHAFRTVRRGPEADEPWPCGAPWPVDHSAPREGAPYNEKRDAPALPRFLPDDKVAWPPGQWRKPITYAFSAYQGAKELNLSDRQSSSHVHAAWACVSEDLYLST